MKTKGIEKAKTNREYNIRLKGYKVYCPVCSKRSGKFDAYCGPLSKKQNRNWKQYRKTKWK